MKKNFYLTLLAFIAILGLSVFGFVRIHSVNAEAVNEIHQVNLTGSNEVPPVTTDTTGSFTYVFDQGNKTWMWGQLFVLNGKQITSAHLHCAVPGENGPVVATLYHENGADISGVLATSNILDMDIATSTNCSPKVSNVSELIDAINAGRIYVNVHSVDYPEGLIRAFLVGNQTGTSTATSTSDTTATSTATTTPSNTATSSPLELSLVRHICPSYIQSTSTFMALGSLGKKMATCLTTVKPGDMPYAGALSASSTDFNFRVDAVNDQGLVQSISSSTAFMQSQMCESDLGEDVDGNGTTSPLTCFDTSHYVYNNIFRRDVTVVEMNPVTMTYFGAVEFMASSTSNDPDSLVSAQNGVIRLNARNDNDGKILLHVFDFMNGSGTSTATSTSNTTATSTAATTPIIAPSNGGGGGGGSSGFIIVLPISTSTASVSAEVLTSQLEQLISVLKSLVIALRGFQF